LKINKQEMDISVLLLIIITTNTDKLFQIKKNIVHSAWSSICLC